MSHIETTTLIKLVAGELSDGRRREVDAHLASCGECRAAFERHRAICDVLGDWRVDAAEPDHWPAIERRLEERRPVVLRPIRAKVGRFSRIAAAILVGVGAGFVGGRFATRDAPAAPMVEAIGGEAALDAVGFSFIESPSATGLFTTVLDLAGDTVEQGEAS